jgi:hypothetical protein
MLIAFVHQSDIDSTSQLRSLLDACPAVAENDPNAFYLRWSRQAIATLCVTPPPAQTTFVMLSEVVSTLLKAIPSMTLRNVENIGSTQTCGA